MLRLGSPGGASTQDVGSPDGGRIPRPAIRFDDEDDDGNSVDLPTLLNVSPVRLELRPGERPTTQGSRAVSPYVLGVHEPSMYSDIAINSPASCKFYA